MARKLVGLWLVVIVGVVATSPWLHDVSDLLRNRTASSDSPPPRQG
ncbi:hypothetical protein GCM10007860_03510 [Chitiniphilus shinanonensis]|uniref:Uncharacterized protein n=1 Tax=Chitiniphilus shinanonensis TaxID=553088 RepID=A0ABQ6BMS0_9NEIS|nr:hypothetical protein [Chitiniphilus shinanonensis]GLS03208.1 hypothetical protein GCM10007860_03510 [Chitiniphilus shinanonensis]